ncbi:MAG: hypothetical protein EOP06_23740, partial [Proteobacteria bacterium]
MASVSYDDALQFRKDADVPLTWDKDVPAPPRDRIEFTRLILETAEDAGVVFPTWASNIPYDDSKQYKNKWLAFQKNIHRYTDQQFFHGLPAVRWSGWENHIHFTGTRTLFWGEYIECIESNYYKPWKTSWEFGFRDGSVERILSTFKEQLSNLKVGYSLGDNYSKDLKFPDAHKITGHEIIAEYMSPEEGQNLERDVGSYFGIEIQLVETLLFGARDDSFLVHIPTIFGVSMLSALIFGAVGRFYSGWLLLLFVF